MARYLELLKLAALIQRPGTEPAAEALAALNELLARVATPEQRAALEASALDDYVIGEERDRAARRELVASQREPCLEQFIPRRGDGLALSASDIDLYRTCPLKYKFARVFAIPQEPTINQRFGILIHQVLERFHTEELQPSHGAGRPASPRGQPRPAARAVRGRLAADRASAPPTTSSSTATGPSRRWPATTSATRARSRGRSGSSGASPSRSARTSCAAASTASTACPDGGYELIDYKTGEAEDAARAADDVQIALYRLGAREAWEVEPEAGATGTCSTTRGSPCPPRPTTPSGSSARCSRSRPASRRQDFEPRPCYEICSWCDYRLICPACEA